MEAQIDRSAFLNFGIENLQQEIILDIISRLPVESVLQCKLVCKAWRDMIHLPYFADVHLRRQNRSRDAPTCPADNLGFLLLAMERSSPVIYLEYDENERSYKTVKRINHPVIKKLVSRAAMVGSCNGLVCFSVVCRYGIADPVYICNPITNEYVKLPKFNMLRDYKGVNIDKSSSHDPGRMVSGFGYCHSTNEYKVVRIIYYDTINKPIIGRVEVYTLGDGNGWRKKGEITYSLVPRNCIQSIFRGILANGALHWIDFAEWRIVAFDLEKEEFSLLPPPPCLRPGKYNYFDLQVLGGRFCVAQLDYDSHKFLNIWLFKESSCEWEIMFSIPYDVNISFDYYWPITLTMRGEVLLRHMDKKGLSRHAFEMTYRRYDPKTDIVEKLMERVADLGTDFLLNEAIPHMSSFVSLRALGETSRRIR